MSIRYKVYQNVFPYHVYNRSNNKEQVFNLDVAFPIFMHILRETAKTHNIIPHHFVLMKNHYHLMLSTPLNNLQKFMCAFQTQTSRSINVSMKRINHIFGNRYGATVIKTDVYISRLIKYIYQNPVKAKIVNDPTKYPFSSLQLYLNKCAKKNRFTWDPYLNGVTPKNRINTLLDLSKIDLDKVEYELVGKSMRSRYI